MPDAILIALFAVPLLLLVVLRVNATMVYLSLCLGAILVQFVADSATAVVAGAGSRASATSAYIDLVLLVAPAVLTMLFMIRTVKHSRRFLNVLPALGVGALALLLVVPRLPVNLSNQIQQGQLWAQLQSLRPTIVIISTVICLLFLWMMRPKHGHDKEPKHHH